MCIFPPFILLDSGKITGSLAAVPLIEAPLLWCLSEIPEVAPSGTYCVVTQEAGLSVITEGDHEIVSSV